MNDNTTSIHTDWLCRFWLQLAEIDYYFTLFIVLNGEGCHLSFAKKTYQLSNLPQFTVYIYIYDMYVYFNYILRITF